MLLCLIWLIFVPDDDTAVVIPVNPKLSINAFAAAGLAFIIDVIAILFLPFLALYICRETGVPYHAFLC